MRCHLEAERKQVALPKNDGELTLSVRSVWARARPVVQPINECKKRLFVVDPDVRLFSIAASA